MQLVGGSFWGKHHDECEHEDYDLLLHFEMIFCKQKFINLNNIKFNLQSSVNSINIFKVAFQLKLNVVLKQLNQSKSKQIKFIKHQIQKITTMNKERDYKKIILQRLNKKAQENMKKSIGSSVHTQDTPNQVKNNSKQQLFHFFDDFDRNCAVYYDPTKVINRLPLKRSLHLELQRLSDPRDEYCLGARVATSPFQLYENREKMYQKPTLTKSRQFIKQKEKIVENRDTSSKKYQHQFNNKKSIPSNYNNLARHKSMKNLHSIPSIKKSIPFNDYNSKYYENNRPFTGKVQTQGNQAYNVNHRLNFQNRYDKQVEKRKEHSRRVLVPLLRRCDSFRI